MSNGDFYAQHIFTLPGGESGKFRPAFAAQTPVNREKRPGPGEERNKNASDCETDTGGTGGPGCWLGWDQPPWVRASPGSEELGHQSAQLCPALPGAGSISPSLHWSQTRLTIMRGNSWLDCMEIDIGFFAGSSIWLKRLSKNCWITNPHGNGQKYPDCTTCFEIEWDFYPGWRQREQRTYSAWTRQQEPGL